MKKLTSHKTLCFLALIVLAVPAVHVSAGQKGRSITGDWHVTVDYEGNKFPSIISLAKDKDGKLTGKWISFWGLTDLKDLKYEGKKLSFTQVYQFGDNQTKVTFAGTVEKGKLSGLLSSDRGQSKAEGKRLKRMPRILGSWDTKIKVGDQEYTAMLVIKTDKQGKLAAEWQSDWGEHQITDVKFATGKLTFTRKSKVQDRQWDSTFEGTLKGHNLSGAFKSERGEITAEAKRLGAAAVGKWDIEIASERGNRAQLLTINPDLSGLLGSTAIKKVDLEGNKISFKIVLEFGDQKFEMGFAGKLNGKKLTGELTSARGTQKVTGKKIAFAGRKK